MGVAKTSSQTETPCDIFLRESNELAETIVSPEPPEVKKGLQPDRVIGKVKIYYFSSKRWRAQPPEKKPEHGSLSRVVELVKYAFYWSVSSVGTYLLWQHCCQVRAASSEMRTVKEFRHKVLDSRQKGGPKRYNQAVEKVANLRQKLFSRIRMGACFTLAFTVSLIAAVALTVAVPCVTCSSGLKFAVSALTAFGAGGFFLRWLVMANRDRQCEAAIELQRLVKEVPKDFELHPVPTAGARRSEQWEFEEVG